MASKLQLLEQKRNVTEKEWSLRNQKISRIRLSLSIETDAAQKFKLEYQLLEEEKALLEVEQELSRLEEEIKQLR